MKTRNAIRARRNSAYLRRLRIESLEKRKLLAASVIAPVGADLVSVGSPASYLEYGSSGDNWYNGSGLSDASIVETGDPVPAVWPEHVAGNHSNRVSRIRNAAAVNTLTFDLGGTFDVSGMALWNSTEDGQSDRGFENTVLSYSTDGGATFSGSDTLTWTQLVSSESPNQGNTPTPPVAMFSPEVQSLPSSVADVTHIRMDVDNFSSEAIVMASEIRFLGEVSSGISLNFTADMVLDSQALIFPDTARFSRDPNGSPYRTEPLLTHDGYQFATWYNRGTGNGVGADIGIYIARRDLSGNTWEVMDTGLDFTNGITTPNGSANWDSHNVISLGIAADGRLHLAYDMHAHDLRYATTPAGRATGPDWHVFNTERDSLNSNSSGLTGVTYPRFINNGDDLLMTFREGGSGNGDIELVRYDSSAALPHRWVDENGNTSGDLTQTIISGAGSYTNPIDNSVSTTRNAYLNGVDVDPSGRIHMTWTWRENSQGSNHDINYAYSDDNGETWRNSAGANLGSTVSINSPGIVISSLDERQALINQQGQAVDGEGGVHALMYHRRQEPGFEWQQGDGLFFKGDSAYFHYYRDPVSGTWTDSMLPTDRVVGSRPSIGFDIENNVYAAYLTRAGGNDILRIASAEKLAAGGYAPWEVIWEDSRDWLGTPLLDQERLLSDNVLSIFLQENTTSDSLIGTNLHVLEYSIDGLEVPGELTVTIADASVSEADGVGATTATVSRNTDTTDPLSVTLVSDDTTEATVLGTITIPAGQTTSAPFNIDAIDDAFVDGTQTVTVTASAAAHADGTDSVDVTDNDTVQDSSFVIAPIAASLQSEGGSFLEYGTDGDNWYNGSGLSDATIVETGDPVPAVWPEHVAGSNQTRVSRIRVAPEVNALTFDLGGSFDVSGMVLWNSTEIGNGNLQTDRGFENTVLSYSTDGGVTFTGSDTLTWTERTADASANQGDNPTPPVAMFGPEIQTLPNTVANVTHIRMDVDNFSVAGADNIVMASEIRFLGEPGPAPDVVIAPIDTDLISVGGSYLEFDGDANNWYNGSGLTDSTIVETGDVVPEVWPEHVSGYNNTRVARIRNAQPTNALTFDLGGTFEVSGMALWNTTEDGQSDRGFENTVLSYSTDGGVNFTGSDTLTWTQLIAEEAPNQGNTPTPPVATFGPEVQMLPSRVANVTHIRMDVDNFSSEAIVAASEVRFIGVEGASTLMDFADAPSSYSTLLADDGARHSAVGPQLGPSRDVEPDGAPSADADGDGSDEDGVMFGLLATDMALSAVNIELQNASAAKVDAWIDFNQDGDWDDPGEKILNGVDVLSGLQTLNYSVPAGALVGDTFARVRVSTAGGLNSTGAASDGEVEDYKITVQPSRSLHSFVDSAGNLLVEPFGSTSFNDNVSLAINATDVRISDSAHSVVAGTGVVQDGSAAVVPMSSITGPLGIQIDTQSGTDTVTIAGLAGSLPGTAPVNVANASVVLGGDLQFEWADGFTPTVGQSFVLVSAAGGVSRMFDSVTLPSAPANTQWDLVIESDEVRLDLTAIPAAQITGIYAGSSTWSSFFTDAVDGDGVSAGNGMGWQIDGGEKIVNAGFDRIYVQFDQAVTDFTPSNLRIFGVNVPDYTNAFTATFDSVNKVGIITLDNAISVDKLRLVISEDVVGSGGILSDPQGNPVTAKTFSIRLDVLVGDGNDEGFVNGGDIPPLGALFGRSFGIADYDAKVDYNSDGFLNGGDIPSLGENFGAFLPTEEPDDFSFDD